MMTPVVFSDDCTISTWWQAGNQNDGLQGFVISPMRSPWSNCIEAVILVVFLFFSMSEGPQKSLTKSQPERGANFNLDNT